MKEEMMSAEETEYSAKSLPLLLHQVRIFRSNNVNRWELKDQIQLCNDQVNNLAQIIILQQIGKGNINYSQRLWSLKWIFKLLQQRKHHRSIRCNTIYFWIVKCDLHILKTEHYLIVLSFYNINKISDSFCPGLNYMQWNFALWTKMLTQTCMIWIKFRPMCMCTPQD